jgi:hypothetical protein
VEERLVASDSCVLTAEIRRFGRGALSRGDFLTTVAFPWKMGDHGDKMIDVSQI